MESLRSFVGPTEVKTGCLRCCIYQDVDDPDAITYAEEWQNETQLVNHIRSHRYLQLLTILDLSAHEPEVRFYTATEPKGMEYIKSIRLQE